MGSSTQWVAAGILAVWNVVLVSLMSRWRIDNRSSGATTDGASQIAEFNVFNPKNYSKRGQQLLPLLVLSQVLLLGVMLSIVFF